MSEHFCYQRLKELENVEKVFMLEQKEESKAVSWLNQKKTARIKF